MKNIAFICLGEEINNCAKYLVKSIKKTNSSFNIIQISDEKDKEIAGIDEKLIFNFESKKFMINCIEAQINTLEKYGPTIFLDADMLISQNLESIYESLLIYDLIFTTRKNNFKIKDTFLDTKYPEFTNKMVNDVMPFNAGFIAASSPKPLKKLLKICKNLSERFHFWYGDQVAQKKIYDSKKYNISILDSKYNYNVKNIDEFYPEIFIYHFKGKLKKIMAEFYDKHIG